MVKDITTVLIGKRNIEIKNVGIPPGEKIHEIMVSKEETNRTVDRGRWFAIFPILPEILGERVGSGCLKEEYGSGDSIMTLDETIKTLTERKLMLKNVKSYLEELLR